VRQLRLTAAAILLCNSALALCAAHTLEPPQNATIHDNFILLSI
jgi:hypothetical protein